MATKRKSTTKYASPFSDVPASGKCIRYDALSKDFSAFYNGNFLGSRTHRAEAEALADAAAYEAARREGYEAGYRAAMGVFA